MTTDNDNKHFGENSRFDFDFDSRRKADTPRSMRTIFGIFMILVYVGVGILLFLNFFNWSPSFNIVRYVGGVILIIYGIWRGYRQFKGLD